MAALVFSYVHFSIFADLFHRVGDIVNTAFAVMLIYRIKRLGLEIPRSVYSGMVARILLSAGMGLIPLGGAFLSRLYRCNKKNSSAIRPYFDHHREGFGEQKVLHRKFHGRRAVLCD